MKRIHLLEIIRLQVAILAVRKSEILSVKRIQHVMLPKHIEQFNIQRQSSERVCSFGTSSNP